MMVGLVAIAIVVLLVGLQPLLLTLRFRRYVRACKATPWPDFTPPLTVILPCKGVDPGFGENVRGLLQQDYPDYELIFATATDEDPAHTFLRALIDEFGKSHARLVTAGIAAGRSQKINNQLVALRHVRPESAALVFVDSDVRPAPDFLRRLVAPLQDERVGATTGFRWYVPETGGFGSYLRAAWNAGGLPMLGHPRLAYTWGGAMGILRTTFDRAGVAQRWAHALTDDFPLSAAVRDLGLSVRFVPRCLLGSHEDVSWREVIEWTNRQTIICRVYNPALWHGIFWTHAVLAVGLILGAVCLAAFLLGRIVMLWPALAFFAVVPLEMLNGVVLLALVRRLLPAGFVKRKNVWMMFAVVPAAMVLILYNSVHSLVTHEISWRGVRYVVVSPAETWVMQDHARPTR